MNAHYEREIWSYGASYNRQTRRGVKVVLSYAGHEYLVEVIDAGNRRQTGHGDAMALDDARRAALVWIGARVEVTA